MTYSGCKQYVGKTFNFLSERYTTVWGGENYCITILKVIEEYVKQDRHEKEFMIGESGKKIQQSYGQVRGNTLKEICDQIAEFSTHGHYQKDSKQHKQFIKRNIRIYTEFGGIRILKGSICNGHYTKIDRKITNDSLIYTWVSKIHPTNSKNTDLINWTAIIQKDNGAYKIGYSHNTAQTNFIKFGTGFGRIDFFIAQHI
jgi:hypothetical protein